MLGKKDPVKLIVEASVDKNDGKKKFDQAFAYESLVDSLHERIRLFTLNLDRQQGKI